LAGDRPDRRTSIRDWRATIRDRRGIKHDRPAMAWIRTRRSVGGQRASASGRDGTDAVRGPPAEGERRRYPTAVRRHRQACQRREQAIGNGCERAAAIHGQATAGSEPRAAGSEPRAVSPSKAPPSPRSAPASPGNAPPSLSDPPAARRTRRRRSVTVSSEGRSAISPTHPIRLDTRQGALSAGPNRVAHLAPIFIRRTTFRAHSPSADAASSDTRFARLQ